MKIALNIDDLTIAVNNYIGTYITVPDHMTAKVDFPGVDFRKNPTVEITLLPAEAEEAPKEPWNGEDKAKAKPAPVKAEKPADEPEETEDVPAEDKPDDTPKLVKDAPKKLFAGFK